MTIEDAKKELRNYKFLLLKKQSEKMHYDEMCREFSSLKSSSDETRVQTSHHDALCDILDKLHKQQVKAAQAVFEAEQCERTIRDKIDKLENPLNKILIKIYIEGKNLRKVAREVCYTYTWTSELHSQAIKKYADI